MEEDFTALLNALVGGEIHWRQQPILQDSFPYINLTLVSSPSDYDLDGQTEFREAVVQVDAWDVKYSGAVTLSRSIHSALSGFRGVQGVTEIMGIFAEGERDIEGEIPQADGLSTVFGRSQDYRVAYRD